MKRVAVIIFCVIAALTNSAVSQEKQQEPTPHRAPRAATGPMFRMGGGLNAHFIGAEVSFGGKLVKGAPYSAEAITENIQVLADGNRIVRRSSAMIYRDGEGRTRHERTLSSVGPYAVEGEPPQMIFINDPVAGINYILDARNRTARKLTLPRAVVAGEGEDVAVFVRETPEAAEKVAIEATVSASVGRSHGRIARVAPVPMPPGAGGVATTRVEGDGAEFEFYWGEFLLPQQPTTRVEGDGAEFEKPVTESLGKQMIEGVEAEGTRTTVTIPAGKIGNELPILIVSEHWYSPELQVTVMSRNSDPRFGENTYRLTNINRSEPARSLFEVPSDYTIKESPLPNVHVRRGREIRNKKSNE